MSKKKSKEYTRAEGAALLRKQLAERKGKKVGLPSKKNVKNLGALAATVALNAVPVGRAAKVVSTVVSKSKATKLASGASKTKTKKFTQGDRARITNTPPKKSKAGPNSPVRGTKVEVTYKTKELTPRQQATLTVGRTSREKTKKAGTYIKGAGTGAYVESQRINRKKKKK
jgi:hypothetical protein